MKHLCSIALVAMIGLGGCYKATFRTGLPGGGGTHDRTVRHFLFGMAGGGDVDVGGVCPNGVASVHEEKTFVDQLITGLTGYLYSPTSVTVECAVRPTAVYNY